MSECMIFYGPIVPEINYSILFYSILFYSSLNLCIYSIPRPFPYICIWDMHIEILRFGKYYVAHAFVACNDYYSVCDVFEI